MSDTEPQPSPPPSQVDRPPTRNNKGFKYVFATGVARLRNKGRHYWVMTVLILVVATAGSSSVYGYLNLRDARSYLFQRLLEGGLNPPEPKDIKIVLIGDDDYYGSELNGRRPIKRRYLAELVDKLVALNVHVIALDFDVRLPNPDSMIIPDDYRAETEAFVDAIKAAATQGKKIVLATPIYFSEKPEVYRRDSDIYQASGLCAPHDVAKPADNSAAPDTHDNIICGYIALPYDPLAVPPAVETTDGSFLDPFSLAIAKADKPDFVAHVTERMGKEVRYSSFIAHDMFSKSNSVFSARDVRLGKVDRNRLDSKVVIVGAYWSRDAIGRGPPTDEHTTPVGKMVGAELHANFAEAFLNSRIFSGTSETALRISEIGFSLVAALVFALIPTFWGKLAGILTVLVLLLLVTSVALRGFGVFFDVFVPLVGLGLHSLYESIFGGAEAGAKPHTA
jgi:CHASE2 domain-containing sensor protein